MCLRATRKYFLTHTRNGLGVSWVLPSAEQGKKGAMMQNLQTFL